MRAPFPVLPLLPCGPLTPKTQCNHLTRPIPPWSSGYCVVCHRAGQDGHPLLERDYRTDPRPDPKPTVKKPGGPETRRERRKRLNKTSCAGRSGSCLKSGSG